LAPTAKFRAVGSTGIEYQTRNAISELSMNIAALRSDIQELSRVIKSAFPASSEEVLLIREISREDAVSEISDFLRRSASEVYPSDISDALRIDYNLVMDVVKELHSKGKIELPHDNTH
jgi:hypothetical protein